MTPCSSVSIVNFEQVNADWVSATEQDYHHQKFNIRIASRVADDLRLWILGNDEILEYLKTERRQNLVPNLSSRNKNLPIALGN